MTERTPERLRILFAPETFNLGETSRAVEVARAVRDAGHEVRFMGYSRRFADHITSAGFDLELLDPELSEADADRLIAVDQGRAIRHPFTTSMIRERVRSELALIERWQPHVIVIGTTLSLFISARAAHVPLVYVRPLAMSRGHLTSMTTFPLVMARGGFGSAVNRLAGTATRTAATALRWKPRSFRVVAAERGVRLPDRTVDALDADVNLIVSAWPVPSSKLADNEHLVGPVYARTDGELPAELLEFEDRRRPVVYVGLGSSARRSSARSILGRLAPMDIDIVTTAGRYLTDDDRASLPANIRVYDFLPAHQLVGLIDASVIHGGEGTVQTACASGAPFAGIGLQPEQRFNLDECARFGNALRFSTSDVRRRRLPGLVERLLHDEGMRQAARVLADRIRDLDGAAVSAAHIIDLARETAPDH